MSDTYFELFVMVICNGALFGLSTALLLAFLERRP